MNTRACCVILLLTVAVLASSWYLGRWTWLVVVCVAIANCAGIVAGMLVTRLLNATTGDSPEPLE